MARIDRNISLGITCLLFAGLLCLSTILGLALPGAADAVQVHFLQSQFPTPGNAKSFGIAVNESTHRIFVPQSSTTKVVQLNPDGSRYSPKPELTGGPELEPWRIAVDNSGGPFDGFIYVVYLRGGDGIVQQFNPGGEASAVKVEKSALPANGTPQVGGLPNVVNNGEFNPRAVALDGAGNLYVADGANHLIDKFSSAGAFLAQFGSGETPTSEFGLAVGPAGEIYAASPAVGLIKFDAAGSCVNSCAPLATGPFSPPSAPSVAVDSAGNVLVSETTFLGESQVRELDSSGIQISVSGREEFNEAGPIAPDESAGKIYVVDEESSAPAPEPPNIKVFGPLLTLPDATTELVTGITGSSAEAHGSISADGGPNATCTFEYTPAAVFAAEGFKGAESAACVPGGPFTGVGGNPVHATLAGLQAGTEYHYRLVGTNANGSTRGADVPFLTLGPTIRREAFSSPTETSVVLEATLNPQGEATQYRFEYVDQQRFEASEWAGATQLPGEIPAGTTDVNVAQPITGLVPGTLYHFRVVATNGAGQAEGVDTTFATFSPSVQIPPDNRAYEQASPVDKNGGNVLGAPDVVQAAPDGNAVTFFSVIGIPGGEGAQNFPIFMASRGGTPAEWTTQGLLPPASTGPRARVVGWSPELSWSYSGNYVPGSPGTFYGRESATHGLTAIASGLQGLNSGGTEPLPAFVGSAARGAVAVFEDSAALVPGAKAGKPNVYLWDRESGSLFLASALNNGQAPSQGAFAGPFGLFQSDGNRWGGLQLLLHRGGERDLDRWHATVLYLGEQRPALRQGQSHSGTERPRRWAL